LLEDRLEVVAVLAEELDFRFRLGVVVVGALLTAPIAAVETEVGAADVKTTVGA